MRVRKSRLQNTILTVVLLFALAPLAGMAWLVFDHGREILLKRTGDSLAQIAFDTVDRLKYFLDDSAKELSELSGRPDLLDSMRLPQSPGFLRERLARLREEKVRFTSLSLFDREGRALVSTAAEAPDVVLQPTDFADLSQRRAFYLGGPRRGAGGENLVIPIAVPLFTEMPASSYAGFLVAELDWTLAYDIIDDVELFRHGQDRRAYLAIVDKQGRVLAAPRFLREKGAVLDRRIQDFHPRYSEILGLNEMRGYRLMRRSWNHRVLVAYARFHAPRALPYADWRAIAVVDTEKPFVEWDELTRKVLLFFLIIGGAVAGGAVVLARRITKPLRELEEVVGRVSAGDLTVRAGTTSRTELGSLARSFNHMILSLAEYREEAERWARTLEARVAERTEELKRAYDELLHNQERLVQSEKMAVIGQMVAAVAHELRSPLGVLSSAAQALLESAETEPETRQWAEMMVAEVSRLNRVITEFLDFARPEQEEEPRVLWPLTDLLEGALEPFKREAERRGVRVERYYEEMPPLLCNPALLTQAFGNLIRNALDSMERGGELVLRLSRQRDVAVVTIADTGQGIDEAIAHKVFDPFFTTKHLGTGLGLSIVRKMVEAHGGEVTFRRNERSGVTFEVRLPLQTREEPTISSARAEEV